VDFVVIWSKKTGIAQRQLLSWIGLARSKFYDWKKRYGMVNEHNSWIPRDWWLTEEEKRSIITFFQDNPLNGYRRITYMMIDQDVVATSPSSVYRVLKLAGLMAPRSVSKSKKGTGFKQPGQAHKHWHIDISYVNISGTFYYLCVLIAAFLTDLAGLWFIGSCAKR